MVQIQESVDIRAPIDRVFEALTDPRRGPEWNPNLVNVRDIIPEPVQVGTTWKQTVMMAGRSIDLTCRVIRLEAPRAGALEVTGAHGGRITTDCAEMDGMTRVTQTIEFEPPKGVFGKMAGGFVSNAVRREMARSMDRQKLTLELEYGAQSGSQAS
jgi:uncharacterized protein YndB with AHSA1/START domain